MSVQPILSQSAAESFAESMLASLTGAAVSMMTSLGHRTGLFDVLASLPPSTSAAIAEAAGLHERYVREWLAAMTTAGVVRYDPATLEYRLPAEHAASLTAAAGPNNLATLAELLACIGAVEDELVDRFRSGGGVPYASYRRFDEVMSHTADAERERALESLGRLSPALVQRLEAGIEVLEIGCGRGHALNAFAARFPRSRFTGYDLSIGAIEHARTEAKVRGLENVRFEVHDVAWLGDRGRYGLVLAFDAVHDQADPARVLENVHRALKPSGIFLMAEPAAASKLEDNLDHPLATLLYAISTFHCTTVSLAQDGAGLGTMWGRERALEMLAAAGFTGTVVENVEGDLINSYFISRRAS